MQQIIQKKTCFNSFLVYQKSEITYTVTSRLFTHIVSTEKEVLVILTVLAVFWYRL